MSDERIYRIAAVLLAGAALFLILERLWNLMLLFQDIILLFALAWLIAFTLAPAIEWFKRPFYPRPLYRRLFKRIPPLASRDVMPHGAAVAVVYLALILILIVSTSGLIPVAVQQSVKLGQQLQDLPPRVPQMIVDFQKQLAGLGLPLDLLSLYQSNLAPRLSELGFNAFRDLLGALSLVATTVTNLLLVIILSLYMNLGGHTLADQIASLVPRQYKREVIVFAQSVNKTFGGFVRGQLIQALLVGIATAVAMAVFRLDFIALGATLAALLMLIPLLGVGLAVLPPMAIAVFQGSLTGALFIFVVMFIFQQVLLNAIMPKIMAESVGLHPLLVFAALLAGIRVGGLWGAFFGIPVAGVLYAMLLYFVGRSRAEREEQVAATMQPAAAGQPGSTTMPARGLLQRMFRGVSNRRRR